jgi:hypothetical protein
MLTRALQALALALPDGGKVFVGSDDLGPLLARQEVVGLYDATASRVGNAYPVDDDELRFLLYSGPVYSARTAIVRAVLTMSTVPGAPVQEASS